MNPLELSNKVNDAINIWAKSSEKLVIAIDGYTGVGKTTLLNNLANINQNIIVVNRDDFMFSREFIREKISQTEDKSVVWELEACDNKKLEDFIIAFKNTDVLLTIDTYNGVTGEINVPKTFDFFKKIMVVEGVFMFHPKSPLNKLWDKRIYLKGDIEKINERRIKREKERWGKDYFPETHPDSYFKQVCIALRRYIDLYHPEKVSDLVLIVDKND
jgi:uridine kinase